MLVLQAYLAIGQVPTLVVPRGHVNPITILATSPDGKYVLSGDDSGLINLWLLNSGENIFTQQYAGLSDLTFTADSKKFMAVGAGKATIWDLFSRDTLQQVKGTDYHTWFQTAALSATETELFAFTNNFLNVWSLESGTVIDSLELPTYDKGIFNTEKNYGLTNYSREYDNDSLLLVNSLTGETLQLISFADENEFRIYPKAFSKDGQRILIEKQADSGSELLVWSIGAGQFIDTLSLKGDNPFTPKQFVAFSPTGEQVLLETAGEFINVTTGDMITLKDFGSGTMELWDLPTGKQVATFEGPPSGVLTAVFSADGQKVIAGSRDAAVRIWETASGKLLHVLDSRNLQSMVKGDFFAADKRLFTLSEDRAVRIWDLNSGAIQSTFKAPADWVYRAQFSPDKSMFLSVEGAIIHLWDTHSWTIKRSFKGHSGGIRTLVLSPDKRRMVSISSDNELFMWEVDSGKVVFKFEGEDVFDGIYSCNPLFSKESDILFLTDINGETQLRSVKNGKLIKNIPGTILPQREVVKTLVSAGDTLISIQYEKIPYMEHLRPLLRHTLLDNSGRYFSRFYSMEEMHTGAAATCLSIWDLEENKAIPSSDTCFSSIGYQPFSILSEKAFSGEPTDNSHDIPIYEVLDNELRLSWKLNGHQEGLNALHSAENERFLVSTSNDKMTKLWDIGLGQDRGERETAQHTAFATLFHIDATDWVVTSPIGLFDASPGAMEQLYYVLPYDKEWEVIDLAQLKARYYEPGLLPKLLGYANERLRPVGTFDTVQLYPKVVDPIIQHDTLFLKLKERNGGIGKVSIFINGKEVEEEINPLPRGNNAKRDSIIQYDLRPHQNYLFKHPDSINIISILAYNEEGWLKSSAIDLQYQTTLAQSKGSGNSTTEWNGSLDPKLYVISIGTSNYTGTQLDLQYADQDATMMAHALQLVGTALFTNGDSLEVHCLSTAMAEANGLEGTSIHWQFAEKENIKATFELIKKKAKAEDVVVVYLSGHGVTQGGTDQTQFYYLTQGIASEDDLGDPATLKAYTISSEELTKWINDIPALKQVLIIDACNSGQIVENLTSGNKAKALNASQIRALDRMKDRTGMFVLAGSASDKVSYEAGEYGQGLLTYALLQGMLGVAARKDEEGKEVIDVMNLFQYARDQVPVLAASINGIQTPMLGFPNKGASFDIGILDETAKTNIPIGNKKPVVVKSNFINIKTLKDDLKLEERLEQAFRQETEKGKNADLIYVDVSAYPGAAYLGGYYQQNKNKISITVKLFQGEAEVALKIPATADPERLVKLIVREVKKALKK